MTAIIYEKVDPYIGLLTLHRPEAANSLSQSLLKEFNEVLETIENDQSLRVLMITGAGEKAFCAGADLKERERMNENETVEAVRHIKKTLTRVANLTIPTLAAINGAAFGGGLELALACDLRFSSESAKMGLTETSLGIIPGAGGTQRLPRLIGLGKAKYLIFTAKRLTSREAQAIGLVEEVFEASHLIDNVLSIAKTISQNGPIGVQQAKKALQLGYETSLEQGLAIEDKCYLTTIPTEDRLEGLAAFKDKRRPHFQGK